MFNVFITKGNNKCIEFKGTSPVLSCTILKIIATNAIKMWGKVKKRFEKIFKRTFVPNTQMRAFAM